jgi:hypothetical protein
MNYKVQSVLFNKKFYTLKKAVNWLLTNKYKVEKVDETENYFRFRQISPTILKREGYTIYRNKNINEHIILVLVYAG